MGKLDQIQQGLARVKDQKRKAELSQAFGIDRELLEDEGEIDRDSANVEAITGAIVTLSERVDEAGTAQVEAIKASADTQVKAAESSSQGQEKRLKAVIQSQLAILKEAVGAIVDRNDSKLEQLLGKIGQGENPQLVEAIQGLQHEQQSYRFDLERDNRGFLKSVTATPIS